MRISLLILSFLLSVSIQADIYKYIDEEGNVVFTDRPYPAAERIKTDKVQTIEAPAPRPAATQPVAPEEADEPEKKGYTKLEITSPKNDSSVRDNAGNILINVALAPALDAGAGDSLVLYMDGKMVSAGPGTQFSLKNVDRGTHSISVAVVDKDTKELKRSSPVKFTLQRISIQH